MSFSSLEFLFFFPVVTALYFLLPQPRRWPMLLVASCLFYMAFVPVYILILGGTIVVDYFAGLAIGRASGGRRWAFLVVSLVANIGTLAVFKYYNFFIENLEASLGFFHLTAALPILRMALPLGLSFHTFQAMSYTIEVYRGNQEPERHFGIYALYVMFYPQLVAGPIERPQNLLHQFHAMPNFSYENAKLGLQRMAWGFFKKSVVADRVAIGVNTVFSAPHQFQGPQLILGTVMFAIQVYGDFSGYSDIALGAARVMGVDLMRNFNNPYFAHNISEFWRRWHISLYSWFNDYLYTPLAIRFRDWGKAGIIFGVMTTFALSGLWHGAAWKFVLWGAFHGLGISVELLTRRWRTRLLKPLGMAPRLLGILLTFTYVNFCYVFFRAASASDAWYIVAHMADGLTAFVSQSLHTGFLSNQFGALGFYRQELVLAIVGTLVMFGLEYLHGLGSLRPRFERSHWAVRWGSYYAIVTCIVFYGSYSATQPFIYFQF